MADSVLLIRSTTGMHSSGAAKFDILTKSLSLSGKVQVIDVTWQSYESHWNNIKGGIKSHDYAALMRSQSQFKSCGKLQGAPVFMLNAHICCIYM